MAATLWWPSSARLAARFVHYGCDVSAVCPRGHVLRHVSGIGHAYRYRSLDSLTALEAAIDAAKPDFVIPCDDRVVWQLHELHGRRPHLRPLIENSLGPATEYGIVVRRERVLKTAQSLAIRIPETQHVDSEQDVRAWFAGGAARSVLKLDGTWGGIGVHIVDSERDAIVALRKLARRTSLGTTVKRLLVNRDPLSAWTWWRREESTMTIQKFIPGRPANSMLACWRGETLASVTVEVLSAQGATGAGIVVRVVENHEISRAVRLLAERLQLTGFYGFDFVIEAATKSAHFIEMNPRCTQLGHLSLPNQGDLAGVLYAQLARRGNPKPQSPIENDVVAFFPQAVLANPHSQFARRAHLDIPWDDPALVRELLLPPWPDRKWMGRVYHYFRPPRVVATVDFETRS